MIITQLRWLEMQTNEQWRWQRHANKSTNCVTVELLAIGRSSLYKTQELESLTISSSVNAPVTLDSVSCQYIFFTIVETIARIKKKRKSWHEKFSSIHRGTFATRSTDLRWTSWNQCLWYALRPTKYPHNKSLESHQPTSSHSHVLQNQEHDHRSSYRSSGK